MLLACLCSCAAEEREPATPTNLTQSVLDTWDAAAALRASTEEVAATASSSVAAECREIVARLDGQGSHEIEEEDPRWIQLGCSRAMLAGEASVSILVRDTQRPPVHEAVAPDAASPCRALLASLDSRRAGPDEAADAEWEALGCDARMLRSGSALVDQLVGEAPDATWPDGRPPAGARDMPRGEIAS